MLSDGDTIIVYLVTSNIHGCQNDTDKVTFITYVDPVVDFSVSPLTGCHTLTVDIDTTGISTTGNYNWQVYQIGWPITYDQSTAIEPQFDLTNISNTIDSNYIITLTITDPATGCSQFGASDTITVYHIPDAEINISTNAICAQIL